MIFYFVVWVMIGVIFVLMVFLFYCIGWFLGFIKGESFVIVFFVVFVFLVVFLFYIFKGDVGVVVVFVWIVFLMICKV